MNAWAPARYHDGKEYKPVIAYEGRKLLRLVLIGSSGVHLVRVPFQNGRYLRPLEYHGRPYPLDRAIRQFRRAGKRLGITKGARKVLRSLKETT